MKKDLSIIIVSYNTQKMTLDCLDNLMTCLRKKDRITTEVIVVDNGSTDGSIDVLKTYHIDKHLPAEYLFIQNSSNLGFGQANNEAVAVADAKYILLLNSDVIVGDLNIDELLIYLNTHPDIGVLTVKVMLKDGQIDMACHRGFPTLWRSFTYFSKLEKVTQSGIFNKFFGGYHLLGNDFNTIHEIDSPTGAFYLTRKTIMDETHGFDPDYFMYGEDLDLSYRIKKLGYKVVYYPLYTVLHLKNQSGIKSGVKKVESVTKKYFFDSMKIFYKKHFAKKYPEFVNRFVYGMIHLKKHFS